MYARRGHSSIGHVVAVRERAARRHARREHLRCGSRAHNQHRSGDSTMVTRGSRLLRDDTATRYRRASPSRAGARDRVDRIRPGPLVPHGQGGEARDRYRLAASRPTKASDTLTRDSTACAADCPSRSAPGDDFSVAASRAKVAGSSVADAEPPADRRGSARSAERQISATRIGFRAASRRATAGSTDADRVLVCHDVTGLAGTCATPRAGLRHRRIRRRTGEPATG